MTGKGVTFPASLATCGGGHIVWLGGHWVRYVSCFGVGDVHKDSVVARIRCVTQPLHDGVKTFATTTSALVGLNEWLGSHGITHAAMEATGVYWKPV